MLPRPFGALSDTQRDLLIATHIVGEGNGADIWRTVEGVRGRRISDVTVYNNLDELAERGLVEKTEVDGMETPTRSPMPVARN